MRRTNGYAPAAILCGRLYSSTNLKCVAVELIDRCQVARSMRDVVIWLVNRNAQSLRSLAVENRDGRNCGASARLHPHSTR